MSRRKTNIIKKNLYWILPLIGLGIFFFLILIAERFEGQQPNLEYHLVRDTAIGFLVAAVVGAMYEIVARSRYDRDNFQGFLRAAMGDRIGDDLWNEVESQILEKRKAREDLDINIYVEKSPYSEHHLFLTLSFDYKLIGLRGKLIEDEEITHFLDAHVCHGEIPRFEFIEVGDKTYLDLENDIDEKLVVNGRFTLCPITLKPDGRDPVPVRTTRKEIAHFPGSYYLVMGDLTKGVKIHMTGLPDDINAFVNMRPHRRDERQLKKFKSLNCDDIMFLPGQALEFQFKPRTLNGPQQPS